MLVEKEIIGPATHWYRDEATGLPRKLVVTPELTKYWAEQGNKMLGLGLTVPVPCEHDFDAHPMTPADKLKNNAGWVKEYRLGTPRKDGTRVDDHKLFGIVDVQDEEIRRKLPHTIRWTSPWISSFTDGQGRNWQNVISHLALTTRPRIINQAPFNSIAAALSMATAVGSITPNGSAQATDSAGFCLSRAGRLFVGKKSKRLRPRYPLAFSIWAGGVKLGDDDMPMQKKGKPSKPPKKGSADDGSGAGEDDAGGFDDSDMGGGEDDFDLEDDDGDGVADNIEGEDGGLSDPLQDANGDVRMEELLCDLLQALGVPMPDDSNENEFKRHLYEAAMSKIKELTSKGMAGKDAFAPDQNKPPGQQPNASQPNPLIQQEQQPMYMSLADINKLTEPMRGVALAMYQENVKLRAEMDASKKVTDSLRDAKLKEASAHRQARVAMLGKLSPRARADLEEMIAQPAMALSMGDGGAVNDPMSATLAVLEKGLSDMPRLLMTDTSALSVQPQPTDGEMSSEAIDKAADDLARMMGCAPEKKAS